MRLLLCERPQAALLDLALNNRSQQQLFSHAHVIVLSGRYAVRQKQVLGKQQFGVFVYFFLSSRTASSPKPERSEITL